MFKKIIIFKILTVTCLLFLVSARNSAGQFCKADVNGDCRVNITDLVTMKAEYFKTDCEACSPPYPAPLQETGQAVSDAEGDDGWYMNGVSWTSQRFIDNGDGTVTDNTTGLVWLKNANCFEVLNWSEALTACNGLADGSCGLSDASIAGDWSLPNVNQLLSLIDRSQDSPALPPGNPFINVQLSYYWTSTYAAYDNAFAWYVFIVDGFSDFDLKTTQSYIWPVKVDK